MAELKLQVGEDYLNGNSKTIHLVKYDNVYNHFTDTEGYTYTSNGLYTIYSPHSNDYITRDTNRLNLITHVPKYTPKEPSDEEIDIAASSWWGYMKEDKLSVKGQSWKAAIEWYKQQIS